MAHVQSVVHELDLALRRAIGQHMVQWSMQQQQQHGPAAADGHKAASMLAGEANELRKRVLASARQPGTAVYEMMRAADEEIKGQGAEQQGVHAAVGQAVSYFNSLVSTTS